MVPRRPQSSTGLRPILSEKRLHWRTVTACAAKYVDIYQLCRSPTEEIDNERDVLLALHNIRPSFHHHQQLGAH